MIPAQCPACWANCRGNAAALTANGALIKGSSYRPVSSQGTAAITAKSAVIARSTMSATCKAVRSSVTPVVASSIHPSSKSTIRYNEDRAPRLTGACVSPPRRPWWYNNLPSNCSPETLFLKLDPQPLFPINGARLSFQSDGAPPPHVPSPPAPSRWSPKCVGKPALGALLLLRRSEVSSWDQSLVIAW
jgi:hypothetical protein